MKYVFLTYADKARLDRMSVGERGAFQDACRANDEAIRQNGYLLHAIDFQGSHTAITLRILNNAVSLAEGPLCGAKEQILGLFFIHARDLNEAIQVATQMPQAWYGPIEVWPMMNDSDDVWA